MKKCEYCGKEILLSHGSRKYCCVSCRNRARNKRDNKETFNKECSQCGKRFETTDRRKIYCSKECNWDAQNSKRDTTKYEKRGCPQCGALFQPKQKRGTGRTYCTDKCRRRAAYLRNTPRRSEVSWESRKKTKWDGNWWKALKRDKFTCQLCNRQYYPSQWVGKKGLCVHHIDGTGEKDNKNHSLDNLQTLCNSCHRKFHSISLVVQDGEYKVAGRIFEDISLNSVKTTVIN